MWKKWLRDREETFIKMLVAHNSFTVSFNSLEFVSAVDALEVTVFVSSIQASTSIATDFLVGSHKKMNEPSLVQTIEC